MSIQHSMPCGGFTPDTPIPKCTYAKDVPFFRQIQYAAHTMYTRRHGRCEVVRLTTHPLNASGRV